MSIVNEILTWTKNVFEPLGPLGLFILSFIESFFFPIPPDFLLIILCLANPELALLYATICAIGSVLGGVFGYGLGRYFGLPILEFLFNKKKIKKVHNLFQKYEVWTISIAGFTPLPYKIFTISAGVFYIDFKKFILISAISRSARFFLVAILLMFYGENIVTFIDHYFNILSIIFVLLMIFVYITYKNIYKVKK